MRNASPIFIIGTERSGSNLLRLMLNQHPSIAIPHPPHILKEMMPLEPLYGDLSDDRNFRKLIDDTITLVKLHFFPWDGPLDSAAVFSEAEERGVYGVKAALYDQYRRAKGKKRWGCKSTFVIRYVDRVRSLHPGAKFIHLVRDGRDVAVSAKTSVFNHFHPHYVGRLWGEQQRTAIELAKKLPAGSMLGVRYEDLLDDPAKTVRAVCAFLGEDYSDALLDYFKSGEAKSLAGSSRSWENVDKPVLKDNRSKYKRGLSAAEIEAFELQAFEELKHFGYPLENDEGGLKEKKRRGLGLGTRLQYWVVEHSLSGRETFKSLFRDRNAVRRIRKAFFVWSLRRSATAGAIRRVSGGTKSSP
jgi:hypothetical protein